MYSWARSQLLSIYGDHRYLMMKDDTHPNVDTASLFRWRHQARVERMETDKKEKESFEKEKKK